MKLKGEDVTILRRGLEYVRPYIQQCWLEKSKSETTKDIREASKIKGFLIKCDKLVKVLRGHEKSIPDFDNLNVSVARKEVGDALTVLKYSLPFLKARNFTQLKMKLTEMALFTGELICIASLIDINDFEVQQ